MASRMASEEEQEAIEARAQTIPLANRNIRAFQTTPCLPRSIMALPCNQTRVWSVKGQSLMRKVESRHRIKRIRKAVRKTRVELDVLSSEFKEQKIYDTKYIIANNNLKFFQIMLT